MKKLVRENLFEINLEGSNLERMGLGFRYKIKKWLEEMEISNFTINDDLTIDVGSHVYLDNKSLKKFPSFIKFGKVSGNFICRDNDLISLEGSPTVVGGNFSCSGNKLTSLEGCPITVGNNFWCRNNELDNLKGCPTTVGGSFYCDNNKIKFTKEEVRALCNVKGNILV